MVGIRNKFGTVTKGGEVSLFGIEIAPRPVDSGYSSAAPAYKASTSYRSPLTTNIIERARDNGYQITVVPRYQLRQYKNNNPAAVTTGSDILIGNDAKDEAEFRARAYHELDGHAISGNMGDEARAQRDAISYALKARDAGALYYLEKYSLNMGLPFSMN